MDAIFFWSQLGQGSWPQEMLPTIIDPYVHVLLNQPLRGGHLLLVNLKSRCLSLKTSEGPWNSCLCIRPSTHTFVEFLKLFAIFVHLVLGPRPFAKKATNFGLQNALTNTPLQRIRRMAYWLQVDEEQVTGYNQAAGFRFAKHACAAQFQWEACSCGLEPMHNRFPKIAFTNFGLSNLPNNC